MKGVPSFLPSSGLLALSLRQGSPQAKLSPADGRAEPSRASRAPARRPARPTAAQGVFLCHSVGPPHVDVCGILFQKNNLASLHPLLCFFHPPPPGRSLAQAQRREGHRRLTAPPGAPRSEAAAASSGGWLFFRPPF